MSDAAQKLARSRAIILTVCGMLQSARQSAPPFAREANSSNADCYILLHDATKLFCQGISEQLGEPAGRRWSQVLPELLLAHPERCTETMALLERKEFKPLSYFQFVAA